MPFQRLISLIAAGAILRAPRSGARTTGRLRHQAPCQKAGHADPIAEVGHDPAAAEAGSVHQRSSTPCPGTARAGRST